MKSSLSVILLIQSVALIAAEVDTISVRSISMDKEIKNVVILPDGYTQNGTPCPVVYTLHGHGGDYRSWVRYMPGIMELADRYDIMVVCPDGENSWYFDSPVDTTYRYETYICEELVHHIDNRFNTLSDRTGRAVFGASMGGHGSLFLACMHPDLWSAAISSSGCLDLRPFPDAFNISERLGTIEEDPDNWENYSVTNMIHLLEGEELNLFIDCGVDDFLYQINKDFHEKLLERKVPHTYMEMPGRHVVSYWRRSLEYQFTFLNNHFTSQSNE